jgi:hypothetical protein
VFALAEANINFAAKSVERIIDLSVWKCPLSRAVPNSSQVGTTTGRPALLPSKFQFVIVAIGTRTGRSRLEQQRLQLQHQTNPQAGSLRFCPVPNLINTECQILGEGPVNPLIQLSCSCRAITKTDRATETVPMDQADRQVNYHLYHGRTSNVSIHNH